MSTSQSATRSPRSSGRWQTPLLLLALLAALSFVALEPPNRKAADSTAVAANGGGASSGDNSGLGDGSGGATADGTGTATDPNSPSGTAKPGDATTSGNKGSSATTSPSGKGSTGSPAAGRQLACKAGQNGGKTAPGVSADRIKLASTNVRSGTGASFLGTSYIGMQAVVNRVNAAGGICGRLLDLRIVDDGWEAARGANYLGNFAKADYFALPVVPSSEGLTQAIINKTIANAGIPVIGTDGMLKEQYADPWVWPVATSTVSTIRIMTKYAWDNGAKTFGIVYDNQYRFGVEGQKAFEQYVKELTGAPPKAQIPLQPRQTSYNSEANRFLEDCGAAGCDFVAFLLTPETANTYINSHTDKDGKKQGFGKIMSGGAQPLFNERFARDCKKACEGMLVWTGYNPPIGGLASAKDVAAYVDDVHSVDPQVDVNNQFLQGAYLGMKVFVAGLEKVGPNLTREGLRDAMNTMTYQSDLSSPLTWGPDKRFANLAAQPFRITTASSEFLGFAEVGAGFLVDPRPGVVPQ
jgi:ABC-type branched-subunit amino acid transport system substrate-binding protein